MMLRSRQGFGCLRFHRLARDNEDSMELRSISGNNWLRDSIPCPPIPQQFSFWPGRDTVAPTGSRLYRRLVIGEPTVDHEAGYQPAIQPTANRRYFFVLRP